jgi:UDP-2,3-diacylglucosamine pyrophosphatase LpxH
MRRIIVISDLHIGGEQLPMLGHPELLCNFLEQVSNYRPSEGEQVELVINGDFVDFLTLEPYAAWTQSENQALTKLDTACRQFPSVFDALAKCIAKVDYFTILLGNHDIESAYPRVHEALLRRLGTNLHRSLFINNNQAYRRVVSSLCYPRPGYQL